jgi:serine O-acetyltransferase
MTSREHIQQKAEVMSQTLDLLIPTYACDEERNPISQCRDLPSEEEVLRILALLDDVFYPGYRSNGLRGEPAEALVIARLDEVYDILYRQLKRAIPLRWESQFAKEQGGVRALSDEEVSAEAERIVGEFFGRIPAVRETLKLDVIAAYKGDPAARNYGEIILAYPGMRAITKHRVAHELYLLDVPLIPRLMSEYIHNTTGIEIHPGARIGESFFIDHGTGVVIGESTEIGHRVKIYQGVTLGAKSFRLDEEGHPVKGGKRHPTIEDDVVIYAGATILGGDTVIGRGAVIGGNVWIVKSVPPGAMVTLGRGNVDERKTGQI